MMALCPAGIRLCLTHLRWDRLPALDVIALQRLGEICNVVPVISKADTLTLEERDAFKDKVSSDE